MIAGKPMIERVYLQAAKCKSFCDIIVATDDDRIADTVKNFGGHAVMTSPDHRSGTDRLWEVLEKSDFDAAVNIQGDEPIVSEKLIAQLYRQLESGEFPVVTPAYFNTSFDDFQSRHVVKAVVAEDFRALYFSRSPIPFMDPSNFNGFYHHIGLYGYLKSAVETFVNSPPAKLEKIEKLEQLRFLENDIPIKVINSDYRSIGVDVPEDILRIEKILREDHE